MEIEFTTGGEAAARALIEQGVDTIFTLSGGHLNPIYLHLEQSEVRVLEDGADPRRECGLPGEISGVLEPGVGMREQQVNDGQAPA